jgi:tRNA-dihydrouridine synthase A
MLGRAAYHEPMLLASGRQPASSAIPRKAVPTLAEVIAAMADYAEGELSRGARLNNITRHMLGLANGRPGARMFRQILSVDAAKRGAGPETIHRAFAALEPELGGLGRLAQSTISSELALTL